MLSALGVSYVESLSPLVPQLRTPTPKPTNGGGKNGNIPPKISVCPCVDMFYRTERGVIAHEVLDAQEPDHLVDNDKEPVKAIQCE